MKIVHRNINDLIPYENNPRNNDAAVAIVAESIRQFGFKVPIIIDKNGVIVAGHTRLKAADQIGLDTIPCVVADDLDDDQIKALRLADNKAAEIATWKMDLLDIELQELLGSDIDMEIFGFEAWEPEVEIDEDDYEVDVKEESQTRKGMVFKLGRHYVMCGDSTDQGDVSTLMGGVEADLLLTDPPYNVDYTGGTKDALTIQNDNMADEDFKEFLVKAFTAADKVMKPGAAFYIWHADTEGYNFRGACRDVGWTVRQCLVWNKNALVMGRQDYHWKHEPCLYGWKDGAAHTWLSDRKQTTVLDFDRPVRNASHPTEKPVKLFDYQIQNNTRKNDVVVDLFGGSGTTLIACEKNGRTSYTMELDPCYVDVILDRWETLTGSKAELIKE